MSLKEGKPDLETESFRAWIKPTAQQTKEEKQEYEQSLKVNYKGGVFGICGFTKVMDKSGKLVFAYRFKHEEQLILLYLPEETEPDGNTLKAILFLEVMSKKIGYQILNVFDQFDRILNETATLDNLSKMKVKPDEKNN